MNMLSDRFNSLRITVEALAGSPAVVVVGGGRERDGADIVARGLARAFAETGASVGLVASDAARDSDGAGVSVVPLTSIHALGGARLTERFATLRNEFDVVLVEIPTLFERSMDAELARCSDGVVLAIELGRRATARDNEIAATLERLSVRRLGVVMTKPELRRQAATVTTGSAGRSTLVRKPSAQRT